MDEATPEHSRLAQQLSDALDAADLEAAGELMSEDVTWGDVDDARGCRNRRDVLATFARLMDLGVRGTVSEVVTGPRGIMVGLSVQWPPGHSRESATTLHQVYLVRDEEIVEILGFDDRDAASAALARVP